MNITLRRFVGEGFKWIREDGGDFVYNTFKFNALYKGRNVTVDQITVGQFEGEKLVAGTVRIEDVIVMDNETGEEVPVDWENEFIDFISDEWFMDKPVIAKIQIGNRALLQVGFHLHGWVKNDDDKILGGGPIETSNVRFIHLTDDKRIFIRTRNGSQYEVVIVKDEEI